MSLVDALFHLHLQAAEGSGFRMAATASPRNFAMDATLGSSAEQPVRHPTGNHSAEQPVRRLAAQLAPDPRRPPVGSTELPN